MLHFQICCIQLFFRMSSKIVGGLTCIRLILSLGNTILKLQEHMNYSNFEHNFEIARTYELFQD